MVAFARRARGPAAPGTCRARTRASPGRSTRTASPTTSTRPPTGRSRPWALDVLPLLVPAARVGSGSRRGLRQRARLLNAVAADLYGPQQLLREGLLPPALVFSHPGFLRAVPRRSAAGRRVPAPGRVRPGARRRRAAGASSARARRRRRAPATRSRTARPSRACFPARSAICTSSRSRRSSTTLQGRDRRRRAVRRAVAARRAADARARTTRPTSSTRTSPGISAFRSSRAPT